MNHAAPERRLGARHAAALCVGMVIGAGIFKTSPMVAQSLPEAWQLYLAWALGGVLSFVGARMGLLFAWSRFAVIVSLYPWLPLLSALRVRAAAGS